MVEGKQKGQVKKGGGKKKKAPSPGPFWMAEKEHAEKKRAREG